MEKKDIVSFSLQELYKNAKVLQASFHDGCLVSTYHNINKSDTARSGIPQFQYPCRVDAVTVVICEKGQVKFTSNLKPVYSAGKYSLHQCLQFHSQSR